MTKVRPLNPQQFDAVMVYLQSRPLAEVYELYSSLLQVPLVDVLPEKSAKYPNNPNNDTESKDQQKDSPEQNNRQVSNGDLRERPDPTN